MKYTVCFLFNENLSKVLLIHKLRSQYAGKLNGVGGKFEGGVDSTLTDCALREVKEETNVNMNKRLEWLTTCIYPSGTELAVYYGVINENEVKQMEDEVLEWFDINDVLDSFVADERFAGEGNVQYFVHAALCEMNQI